MSFRELDILMVSPGFPATEDDDRCLPAIQDFLLGTRAALPLLPLRVLSLHYPFAPGERRWRDIEVKDIGGRNLRWPFRALVLARAFRDLGLLADRARPSLIHAFLLTDASLVACWFARHRGIPFVVTLLGQDVLPFNRYARWHHGPAAVVAPSERAAQLFHENFGGRRPQVIPWGVASRSGSPDRGRARPIDILGVGSLLPMKDFSTFVRVVEALHREGLARRAVIIGDGPERADLEARIARAGLGDVIEMRGSRPRLEVFDTMLDASVLLHPSRHEAFGMVFAEARSRGMYVVSRAVGAAAAGPAWSIASIDDDFVPACRGALARTGEGPAPDSTASIDRTVQSYLALYRRVAAARNEGGDAR